ncbi:hypothetical protein BFJ66_g15883 [Fusarium oxysporum f. sp. cepae]|uniref:Uncharacterized protein n=1 Tax=Fusarium oxysporum f. sp. cepae TaxID=396571 RepID=A0A3L6N9I6_FUSOX|nr:hypothetical protein BFJ65_g12928 [Fusarium oxysporum f. sp. cepae]RKK31360.1 hypothetical protein BFJ66_g15883 [Fusarium oxysporum f. sp. cepae]RKK37766.1 hypothetical protein BFJ67_g12206 [Fusarium oxysporum f. sp. cepae]
MHQPREQCNTTQFHVDATTGVDALLDNLSNGRPFCDLDQNTAERLCVHVALEALRRLS